MADQSSAPRLLREEPQKDEQEGLRAELTQAQEEVLRLRDLLIGKEAELGALRGRLAEIEGGAAPLLTIAARLRMLTPGLLKSVVRRLLRRGP
ncbi:MAG TPA: hypothetical protein VFS64_09730 [Solirubrobacterales bacterium]|nr:hypothetical protein [Solirubrobacterales bacterium]